MGQAAASTLLGLIRDDLPHPRPAFITVYPKLVVRKSTAIAPPPSPSFAANPAGESGTAQRITGD
jgi:hypothetical protein